MEIELGDLERNDVDGALRILRRLREAEQRGANPSQDIGEALLMMFDDPTEYMRRVREEFGEE